MKRKEKLETPRHTKEHALKLRKRIKSKKPDFQREEGWRYERLKKSWRRARGLDSKMRKKYSGWPKSVEIGYRGPKEARDLHPSGYEEVLVRTLDDIAKVDPKTQAIRIAHGVGARKRVELLDRAKGRKIHILNPREVKEELIEEVTEEEAKKEKAEAKEEEEGEKKS